MARAGLVLALSLALGACAEFWRWPERPKAPPPKTAESREGPQAIPPGAGPGQYTVRPGDTVYSIAFRHQLDERDLAAWNGIGADRVIRPGQVLNLRPPPGASTPSRQGVIRSHPTPPAQTTVPSPPAAPMRRDAWRWPVAGKVVKAFGEGKGVDIAGELGQPVLAAAPGKVVYSGSALRGYGELVIIKHDDTYLSAYGYNRRRLVEEGAMVAAGQPIAELGIGPEQKPVLHFEVREKGRPVDPMGFLPKQH